MTYQGKRYAVVRGLDVNAARVESYLPANYKVIWSGLTDWHYNKGTGTWKQYPALVDPVVVIEGRDGRDGPDGGGFSLDGYVIPRLGSGLMRCDEIDLSHPLFKQIPE